MVKAIAKCDKSITDAASSSVKGDHKQTQLTLWVDKGSKQITKMATKLNSDGTTLDISGTIGYGRVSIDKPSGAKPFTDVLSQLQQTLADSGIDITQILSSFSASSSLDSKSQDSERKVDIKTLQTQLEVFFSENGYYPSLADLNNASWRAQNMKSLDPAALSDPANTSGSTDIKAAAQAGYYAYAPKNSDGGSCEADDTTCATYTLTAILADGQEFSVKSLD
jgi:hypothetical protein